VVLALGCASACGSVAGPPQLAQGERPPNTSQRTAPEPSAATPEPARSFDAGKPDAGTTSGGAARATAIAPAVDPVAEVLALSSLHSASRGAPAYGSLEGAVALPDLGPGFRHNDKRPYEARFGTVELVQAIVRAAGSASQSEPESATVVNDLSLQLGGPIAQHGSHQNGRDVDILFHVLDRRGQPLPSVGVPIDPKGLGWDFKDLSVAHDDVRVRFDAKRTWRFIAALLEAGGDEVQRIFIVEHLRSMLLAEAERVRVKPRLRERFEMITCQPETPHDDHMHVRFFCSAEDIALGCVDGSPMYPFRRAQLKALGVAPVLETAANRRARKSDDDRTTSRAQARKKAEARAPMHARVRAFLDEREAWAKKPSVGRLYCK
jgi:penicillin-insensitive murein endopeptidase